MYRTKSYAAYTALCVALISSFAPLALPMSAIANSVRPPVKDGPGGRTSGGSRPGDCLGRNSITALIPAAQTKSLTADRYPTLFFHVPPTTAKTAEFVLQNENKQQVYRTKLRLAAQPGIASFKLPAVVTSGLTAGKNYRWFFSVVCNEAAPDKSGNPFVMGWIKHVNPSPALVQQLRQASPRDRVALYKQSGFWYEALSTLAQLRRSYPRDAALAADWANLLGSAGLNRVAREPLVQFSALEPIDIAQK
ncbi:DUF928 domain-containing protein [Trichocoleus sp. FACHB-262]|uniref:DUF928 domain-containing protein n=1 Tax=Trichocoleus sp. FACHB-262 TaxID=2692869 RepID=UPI0016859D4C|nr:DUF928 domain-containing protein [Trichocoleus sp. FACHB-262]MBD2123309.1 DUF928 domain-containing protein [Trichocoleus sp. FACHB-262]